MIFMLSFSTIQLLFGILANILGRKEIQQLQENIAKLAKRDSINEKTVLK